MQHLRSPMLWGESWPRGRDTLVGRKERGRDLQVAGEALGRKTGRVSGAGECWGQGVWQGPPGWGGNRAEKQMLGSPEGKGP